MFKIIKLIKEGMIRMFKFTKDSGCVKVWVTLIVGGTYTVDQVPKLFNLKDCVQAVLTEMGAVQEQPTQPAA